MIKNFKRNLGKFSKFAKNNCEVESKKSLIK